MTKKSRPRVTAAELADRLNSNPTLAARKQADATALAERSLRIRSEEEPILMDLKGVGLEVQSSWDLVKMSLPYPQAIPVLLEHLQRPYSDVVREGIARALAVPDPAVQSAWKMLVDEYRKAPIGRGIRATGDMIEFKLGAKEGLACALAASVSDETLPELIDLARDRTLGESRVLLLSALKGRRSTDVLVKQALDDLATDPDLKQEIAAWSVR